MRIVHYYPRALVGDGGCTASVHGWASGLAAVGADVAVAYDVPGEPREVSIEWMPLPHRHFGKLAYPLHMENVLGEADLLMLHSGWVYHNIVASRSAVRAGIPYVVTPHGAYDPNVFRRRKMLRSAWWRMLERRVIDQASAVHIFFDQERANLDRLGYQGRVLVAPNGVTVPPFEPTSERQTYALWIGRFDIETKGIDLLLRAYASIPADRRPKLRLHGPDWRDGKAEATSIVRHLGLEDWVTIGRPVYGAEKWKLLRECALFVFASRWDASSIVVLEAAAAGTPIVATKSTFVARALAEEGAAILVDPSPTSVAAGILQAMSDAGRRAGAKAAPLVGERFAWRSVSRRLLDQLEAL